MTTNGAHDPRCTKDRIISKIRACRLGGNIWSILISWFWWLYHSHMGEEPCVLTNTHQNIKGSNRAPCLHLIFKWFRMLTMREIWKSILELCALPVNFYVNLKLLQNKELKKIKSSLHTFENDLSIKYLTDCLSAKATFIVIHWNLIITLFPIKQYSI